MRGNTPFFENLFCSQGSKHKKQIKRIYHPFLSAQASIEDLMKISILKLRKWLKKYNTETMNHVHHNDWQQLRYE